MIVHLTVAGQPMRVVTPRPDGPPEQRAAHAAHYAAQQTVIAIRREWRRAGRQISPNRVATHQLVSVTAVYCCARCERRGDRLALAPFAPTAVPRAGVAR